MNGLNALDDAEQLPVSLRTRILGALDHLVGRDFRNVRKLNADPPEWRLRVGNWRIRFAYDDALNRIWILRVLPRDRAYRD